MSRQFKPLSGNASDKSRNALELKGIIFDVDGTLCEPQNHMFGEMRSALNIEKGTDILDHIYSLPKSEQEDAHAKIQAIERKAMSEQVPQAGLVSLMEYLDSRRIRKGICTRNFDAPVTHLLQNHLPGHLGTPNGFEPIVTREFRPPKPSPRGIWHICQKWGLIDEADVDRMEKENREADRERGLRIPVIMVGDSVDDIAAGYDAGAATVLLRSEGKEDLEHDVRTDVSIGRLDELMEILENGFLSRHGS